MKYALVFAFIVALSAAVFAIEMSSSSYKIESATPTEGGVVTGSGLVARTSVETFAGKESSSSYIVILGFDFPPLGITLNQTVTFALEFNINGIANDSAEADAQKLSGNQTFLLLTPSNLSNFYLCMEDTAISGTPAYGIVFSGKALSYINLSRNTTQAASANLRLSQAQERNRFVLPITTGGCSNVRGKFQLIKIHGFMPQAFMPFFQGKSPLEIILSYPDVDIMGDFVKAGSAKLVLEKNETTDRVQIIVRD
ncbi:MAG: hypothetical protein HYW26_00490 [Candidatus Aenigmarchaeota archaeon]|nr:hypothetical protein [Candidatus Aenigmarchaeota archaeon]